MCFLEHSKIQILYKWGYAFLKLSNTFAENKKRSAMFCGRNWNYRCDMPNLAFYVVEIWTQLLILLQVSILLSELTLQHLGSILKCCNATENITTFLYLWCHLLLFTYLVLEIFILEEILYMCVSVYCFMLCVCTWWV